LHYIVTQAARLTDAEDAIIFRYDESGPITVIATNPGGQIHYSLDSSLLNIVGGWAEEQLLEKEPLVLADLPKYWSDHGEFEVAQEQTHKALLGIPLAIGDELYGGLLMFYSHVREFSHDDLELGFTFADQAALAIANNRLRERVRETAAATERSRLARELHDAVTQTLFSASLIAETLSPTWESDPTEGRQLLKDLRQLTRGALAEMRTLLMELRPATLEEAILSDLLNQLSEAFVGRTGIPVQANVNSSCQLPVNVRIALYRIAQESLNNVVKHARADNVEMILEDCSDDEGVNLTIRDDGRGFDPSDVPGHRLGLEIIKERAQAIEAELAINSAPGEGTSVSVQWNKKQEGK
jgi:two-component system nitrate/nitrite sensor histidine kinase NarX